MAGPFTNPPAPRTPGIGEQISLADLLGSVNTGNMTGVGLNAAPVAYQKPRGFLDTIGKIGDVLAAFGGGQTVYTDALTARENAYNQAVKQQQFQNIFSQFVQNPNNPEAFAQVAAQAPDVALKFREALTPKPQAQGSQPREVIIANMLADPNTRPEVKARLEALVAPTPPRERLVATERGYLPESQAVGLAPYRAPERASGGGSSGGPQFLTPDQKTAYGLDPDQPWIIDNKGQPRLPTGFKAPTGQRGAVAPEEVLSTIARARKALPAASPGGLAGAATKAAEFFDIPTERSKADARLRVLAGKLTASVPRFEGPQALPEVKLYQAMAADVANSDLPVQSRLAALAEMEQLILRNQQVKAQRRPGAAPTPKAATGGWSVKKVN